jgi:hypothetical protein
MMNLLFSIFSISDELFTFFFLSLFQFLFLGFDCKRANWSGKLGKKGVGGVVLWILV